MKVRPLIATMLLFAIATVSTGAALPNPEPAALQEINAPDARPALSPAAITDRSPLSLAEETALQSLEQNSGFNPDKIAGGTGVIDLILVVLLIYLILRLF